jgi:hypothetical protein
MTPEHLRANAQALYAELLPHLPADRTHCSEVAALGLGIAASAGMLAHVASGYLHHDGSAGWHVWLALPGSGLVLDSVERGKVRLSDGRDLEPNGHTPPTGAAVVPA